MVAASLRYARERHPQATEDQLEAFVWTVTLLVAGQAGLERGPGGPYERAVRERAVQQFYGRGGTYTLAAALELLGRPVGPIFCPLEQVIVYPEEEVSL